jgi:hypothetical protein
MSLNTEFLTKRLARWFISNVKLPAYQPKKPFLRQLKSFFCAMFKHDKRAAAKWYNGLYFMLKLADNDPAYYERLIAAVYGLQAVKLKYSKLDMAIIKGYYGLPVRVGDFKAK